MICNAILDFEMENKSKHMVGVTAAKHQELHFKLGTALLTIQRIEFITHGLVSHFPTIQDDKQFKGLTPRAFLDNDEESKKLRKQTLGQIFRILKLTLVLTIEKELNSFLEKRNHLIHSFWRSTIDGTFKHYDDAINFCNASLKEGAHLEKFYEGFIIEMLIAAAQKEEKVLPELSIKQQIAKEYFRASLIKSQISD